MRINIVPCMEMSTKPPCVSIFMRINKAGQNRLPVQYNDYICQKPPNDDVYPFRSLDMQIVLLFSEKKKRLLKLAIFLQIIIHLASLFISTQTQYLLAFLIFVSIYIFVFIIIIRIYFINVVLTEVFNRCCSFIKSFFSTTC